MRTKENLQIVKHRVNTISALRQHPPEFGCEIDLRSYGAAKGAMILTHDAWTPGENFEDWLAVYAEKNVKGPLILNTKEDLLEERALELLQTYGIKNYFFLDTAAPTLVRHTTKLSNPNFAVRYSKFEPLAWVMGFKNLARWVWADCFNGEPPHKADLAVIKQHFSICLVSPELQGIKDFDKRFLELMPLADAVCTKNESWWLSHGKN